MLRFFPFFCLAAALRAAVPGPLADALKKSRGEAEHWAYTETTEETDGKARPQGTTIVRFDPSKPYPEQFTPLLVHGQPPTAKDLERYREIGEKRGKRLMDKAERDAKGNKEAPRVDIGLGHADLDLDEATVTAEDASTLTYTVPLKDDTRTLPVEKIALTVRVTKAGHVFDSASLRLLAPVRLKVVVRLIQGQLDVKWSTVDPKYPPTMTEERGSLAASLLFIHIHGWETMRRAEFRHVTPYAERFGVHVGALKALPF